jgi:ADP-ribosylglycohydrolase/fructose-1,6-bisphosphatase/inositol monophosphatase family enzyme
MTKTTPCPLPLTEALTVAREAALQAGALLRESFHRPAGPEGNHHKNPADTEAEIVIRDRLLATFPGTGFTGEEDRDPAAGQPGQPDWVVDPHDGTAATKALIRGGAVSIALVWQGRPVLGVVYAFAAPDDDGDLFTWAEDTDPLRRNGAVVERPMPPAELSPHTVVAVSHEAARCPRANQTCVAPARVLAMPSIAYRLALAAVGEADVAVTFNHVQALDVAGGHALLIGAGLDLYDPRGKAIRYRHGRQSIPICLGGPQALVKALGGRDWRALLGESEPPGRPNIIVRRVRDAGRLARAQGCLLGQLAGDALGSAVEFQDPARIQQAWPEGLRDLIDGGTWNTLAGQPTDDSEMALALARTVGFLGGYQASSMLDAYADWVDSDPFDIGTTTRAALGAAARTPKGERLEAAARGANTDSQANGSLMRVSPIGILAAGNPALAAEIARADSGLTHPHPICRAACAAFAAAIAVGIAGGDRAAMLAAALDQCGTDDAAETLRADLRAARDDGAPEDFMSKQGWVRIALRNAFAWLAAGASVEDAIIATVARGGDTDTNGAIVGALLGAVDGRQGIPMRWRRLILTCRPTLECGAKTPRPPVYWPDDALALAESLLGIDLGRTGGDGDDADEETDATVVPFPGAGTSDSDARGGAGAGRFWTRAATWEETPAPADLRALIAAGRALLARWHACGDGPLPNQEDDTPEFDAVHDWLYGAGMVMTDFDGPAFSAGPWALFLDQPTAAAVIPRANLLTLRMVLHTLARAFRHSGIGSTYGPFEDAFRSGALDLIMTRLEEVAGE